jgi:hypothetical protein
MALCNLSVISTVYQQLYSFFYILSVKLDAYLHYANSYLDLCLHLGRNNPHFQPRVRIKSVVCPHFSVIFVGNVPK